MLHAHCWLVVRLLDNSLTIHCSLRLGTKKIEYLIIVSRLFISDYRTTDVNAHHTPPSFPTNPKLFNNIATRVVVLS